ncbi:hypothetical protein NQ318_015875 [Aromia moschata]|uniref:Mos1 transposase HTH domain-containing protein n=1 Tax=Aromia moschata TaxID=1265417 RepID=A0AAV8YQN9_9CUCU|nr:hypothetical protein NQ318_015875 [Aromia moschata]
MQHSLEQRMAIKFCVKLEKSAAETIPMLKKAFGVDCLSDRQIFRKAFAEGREDVNDENRAGRPSTSSSDDNVKRVRDLLNTNRRLSVRLISETLDITKTIVHEIVSESLGMRKVCAKFVPKVLTDDQKARRVETCQELLDTCEDKTTPLSLMTSLPGTKNQMLNVTILNFVKRNYTLILQYSTLEPLLIHQIRASQPRLSSEI